MTRPLYLTLYIRTCHSDAYISINRGNPGSCGKLSKNFHEIQNYRWQFWYVGSIWLSTRAATLLAAECFVLVVDWKSLTAMFNLSRSAALIGWKPCWCVERGMTDKVVNFLKKMGWHGFDSVLEALHRSDGARRDWELEPDGSGAWDCGAELKRIEFSTVLWLSVLW